MKVLPWDELKLTPHWIIAWMKARVSVKVLPWDELKRRRGAGRHLGSRVSVKVLPWDELKQELGEYADGLAVVVSVKVLPWDELKRTNDSTV